MVKRATLGEEDETSELSASLIPRQRTMRTTTPTKEVIRGALEEDETSDLSMSPLSQEGSEPINSREEAIVNNVLQSPSSANNLLQLSNIEHFVNIEAVDSSDIFVQSCSSKRPILSPNMKVNRKRLDSKMTPGKIMGSNDNPINTTGSTKLERKHSHSMIIAEGEIDDVNDLASMPEDVPAMDGGKEDDGIDLTLKPEDALVADGGKSNDAIDPTLMPDDAPILDCNTDTTSESKEEGVLSNGAERPALQTIQVATRYDRPVFDRFTCSRTLFACGDAATESCVSQTSTKEEIP